MALFFIIPLRKWRTVMFQDMILYKSKLINVYSEIEECGWIVSYTAYKEDFYGPINDATKIIAVAMIFGLIVMVIVTINISKMVIKPIKNFEETVLQGVNGDLSVRVEIDGDDEINQLGEHFNKFVESLESQNNKLKIKLAKRIWKNSF